MSRTSQVKCDRCGKTTDTSKMDMAGRLKAYKGIHGEARLGQGRSVVLSSSCGLDICFECRERFENNEMRKIMKIIEGFVRNV